MAPFISINLEELETFMPKEKRNKKRTESESPQDKTSAKDTKESSDPKPAEKEGFEWCLEHPVWIL